MAENVKVTLLPSDKMTQDEYMKEDLSRMVNLADAFKLGRMPGKSSPNYGKLIDQFIDEIIRDPRNYHYLPKFLVDKDLYNGTMEEKNYFERRMKERFDPVDMRNKIEMIMHKPYSNPLAHMTPSELDAFNFFIKLYSKNDLDGFKMISPKFYFNVRDKIYLGHKEIDELDKERTKFGGVIPPEFQNKYERKLADIVVKAPQIYQEIPSEIKDSKSLFSSFYKRMEELDKNGTLGKLRKDLDDKRIKGEEFDQYDKYKDELLKGFAHWREESVKLENINLDIDDFDPIRVEDIDSPDIDDELVNISIPETPVEEFNLESQYHSVNPEDPEDLKLYEQKLFEDADYWVAQQAKYEEEAAAFVEEDMGFERNPALTQEEMDEFLANYGQYASFPDGYDASLAQQDVIDNAKELEIDFYGGDPNSIPYETYHDLTEEELAIEEELEGIEFTKGIDDYDFDTMPSFFGENKEIESLTNEWRELDSKENISTEDANRMVALEKEMASLVAKDQILYLNIPSAIANPNQENSAFYNTLGYALEENGATPEFSIDNDLRIYDSKRVLFDTKENLFSKSKEKIKEAIDHFGGERE